jgi:RNA polymerase sigma-70 factor (ECF subfamily)
MEAGPGRFPTTSWSVVLAAQDQATRRPALEKLCGAYWSPVYGFVRRLGNDPEAAQDFTQSFFTRLLEKDAIAAARRDRGRFRSFLLGCLKNFLTNEWDRAHAQMRGGDQPILPFEFDDAERWLKLEPADHATPERIFERRWAATVLQRGLLVLRGEYESAGQGALFERLKPLLMAEHDESQRAIATRLGMTEGALKMAMLRLRRRYRALLKAEIAETVHDPSEIDDEIRHLFAVLQQP